MVGGGGGGGVDGKRKKRGVKIVLIPSIPARAVPVLYYSMWGLDLISGG